MSNYVSDEDLLKVVDAVHTYPTKQAAADALGLSRETLRDRYNIATRRNLTGAFLGGVLPPGYTMGKVTSLRAPDGTVMEWQHQDPDAKKLETMFEELAEKLMADLTPLPLVPLTAPFMPDFLTVYPIVDVHLGQYSWHKETGENYDLDIAKGQFLTSTTSLHQLTPNSGTALVVVLGDFFHADNNEATTRRSGNHLDVDGRHDKVLHLGAELVIWQIDMALQKHETVHVKVMRGNHDEYASKALGLAIWVRYQNNPRVVVHRDPQDLWSYQWGINMLSFTHGDNVKAEDMPGVMAAFEPVMWGATKYRFGYSGHYHRRKVGPLGDEKNGAEWLIIPAFTAKDAWNRSMGHSSNRKIQAMTFHLEEGQKNTTFVNV